jgi:hypothetical protein
MDGMTCHMLIYSYERCNDHQEIIKSLSDSQHNMQEHVNIDVRMFVIYHMCMFYNSI